MCVCVYCVYCVYVRVRVRVCVCICQECATTVIQLGRKTDSPSLKVVTRRSSIQSSRKI